MAGFERWTVLLAPLSPAFFFASRAKQPPSNDLPSLIPNSSPPLSSKTLTTQRSFPQDSSRAQRPSQKPSDIGRRSLLVQEMRVYPGSKGEALGT